MWKFLSGFSLSLLLFINCTTTKAQTKTYFTVGIGNYNYSTKSEAVGGIDNRYFFGLAVDKYISYHYAISTGAVFLHGGYDNGISKWDNRFVRVPLYIKAASLGETIDAFIGLDFNVLLKSTLNEVDFNVLLKSTLNEVADTLANRVTTDVTSAFPRVQPDFTFGTAYRLKRLTFGMKCSFSLTNRYSTKVKDITDRNPVYYGSWYAYSLSKDDHKLRSTVIQVYISVRLF